MKRQEKTLALVTQSESTKNELCNQLSFLLEGYMTVVGYALEAGIETNITADLIVLSSDLMAEPAKGLLDESCPVIIANRSLNLEKLDLLFQIPRGTEVIVVNDDWVNSLEVIKLLKEIGIDDLNYVPYAPGHPLTSRSNYAITPGEVTLVPVHIGNVIDIGPRVIDLTTIIQILSLLGLLDEKSRLISTRYLETIIRLNKRLNDSIAEANRMNQYLVKVVNQVNDGVLAYSDEGVISVCNRVAADVLHVTSGKAIGQSIDQIVQDSKLLQFLSSVDVTSDQLFRIHDTEVLISRFHIDILRSTVCTIKNTKETLDMEKKLRQNLVKKGYVGKYRFGDIIGDSPILQHTVLTAKKLAHTDLGILIYGETGVGKELFASAIHNESEKSQGPFLAVNFSAMPEELVESELFGYEEGSFTGAKRGGQRGLFEQANGGTIFLDEIGDISMKIQTRLLRVLQEKEIRRVGGTQIIPIDVRIIAATNKNLDVMCQEGIFREDLYFRLKRLYLEIPPLRARADDMEALVKHFIEKHGKKPVALSSDVVDFLRTRPWPGNVRELENVIEYILAVHEGDTVTPEHLPYDVQALKPGVIQKNGSTWLDMETRPEEYHFLLSAIQRYHAIGQAASRQKLRHDSLEAYPQLTEGRIRKMTDRLLEEGFITKQVGRAGMSLTSKGIRLLDQMVHLPDSY